MALSWAGRLRVTSRTCGAGNETSVCRTSGGGVVRVGGRSVVGGGAMVVGGGGGGGEEKDKRGLRC